MTAALIGIGIAALALAAGGGYPLTVAVLHLAARGDRSSGAEQSPATAPPAQAEPDPSTALRGGTWIGILERLAITGAILVGYPAAIAVVIAVKGLGRFPELTATGGDRKSTRLNSSHVAISYAVFCLQKKYRYTFSYKLHRRSEERS